MMPKVEDLPPTIHDFAFRNSFEIRVDPDFKPAIEKSCDYLDYFCT